MRRPAAFFPIALALGAIIIVREANAQAAATTAARYTFTTIDVPFPGVGETAAIGINNRHQIVGFYNDGTGHHSFIDDEGRFSSIDVSFPGASETSAFGINDRNQNDRADDRGNRGQIVGQYQDKVGTHGFVDNKGRFSPIDVPFPGVSATFARDINDRGQIVGNLRR
jgi:hypothetical protein